MRIIAGTMRGLRLASVGKGDAGAHLRPTTDRVRESLFNVLSGGHFGDPIEDAVVLDLFAGTGALGLEALSRGAAHVTFVDDGGKARSLIRENIGLTRSSDRTTQIKRDATRLGPVAGDAATLVFLDPPYGKDLGARALAAAVAGGWIAPGALIVWEESAPQAAPEGFDLLDTRRYGDTHVTFLERSKD
ncbi:16S rRNA (guanine(966)-N(2))-methyltransferase RsmD [Psychromarinibacter halotolerans]|uniref:16S rRNA (Guanine(966)-N(2))-methyltransferase RsmD n=1 Tax=Psychromarinibacter halotolerans TaxID=1775175 RepID=A0ABV7GIX5_9RHOB|nr:16S rRNA (guanine(966)-N(2))-methyltransferase RsmD [Psychromarinibacter halotolerans]MAQ81812.1 16S rRNA (guanine(966)-N(2))-methyltransferase RsmD [Maritimibacter sp.]MDF0596014.1 16S rRNA (guanine(966)-N(2))-methyltransferase RsmD [Psychromarinibacter halotolerans]